MSISKKPNAFTHARTFYASFALVGIFLSQSASAGTLDCGNWTVDVKSGTYDSTDSVWWNGAVQFTHHGGTYTNNSGSTVSLPSSTCSANTNNDNCSITLNKNGQSKTCNSPTLKIDTTVPTCGNWSISTSGQGTNSWTPGQDVTFLPWYWSPWNRTFTVSVSDGQSGVPSPTETYSWPSDSLSDSSMQSFLGDFARVTVTDNAGNSTECVGPRKRVDGFEPMMPALDCDNFNNGVRPLNNPYQGVVKCGLSDSAGPSKTYSYYRVKSYAANLVTGAIGALQSDTNWVANGSFDTLIDTNGSRIRSGAEYDANSAPLRYALTPTDNQITQIQGRLCEFVGTSASRCTDSNVFEIKKLPPPPPIPVTAGDGWYDCQDTTKGKIIWYSPDETVPGTDQTLTFTCTPDGVGTGEPKSKAKISGTIADAGSEGCWCWDNEAPSISGITASPTTWTNQAVTFVGTASNTDTGGAPYGGIQYSCDGGTTWSSGTVSTTANFTCDTVSTTAQVAQVRACDQAKNCSATSSVNFFIEKTAPAIASFKVTGKKKNWNAHVLAAGDSDSTQYTYKKDVTVSYDPSDAGGSGLKAVRLSCNPTFQDSGWESATAGVSSKAFDLTDGTYGCNGAEGNKTVYAWAKDNAGNVSTAASASILYDKSAPSFNVYDKPILLKAVANYTYSVQSPTDGAGTSGLKDYSFTWTPETGAATDFPNLSSSTNNFGDLARYVNSSCDSNSDGKCIATIKITVEDNAGNATTKEERVEIIANSYVPVIGNAVLNPAPTLTTAQVADLYDRYTYSIQLQDANGNVIRPVAGILDIRGDWSFANDASFLGNEKAVPDGDVRDGAVWYNWDDGNWVSNTVGNSTSKVYVGNTRTDGNYTIQVRSSVPTAQGYAGLTRNAIKIGSLRFSNALSAANAAGCPSGYVCDGANSNPSFDRSLGTDLAADTNINGYLAFKPALEVIPSKNWNDLTDGTWQNVTLTFKNNSTQHSFSPSKYGFDFRFDTYLGNFASLSIKGDLGTYSGLSEGSLKKISFLFSSGFSVVGPGSSVSKTISVNAKSGGIGFGKIGFTAYLPWLFENNAVCNGSDCATPVATTGYNTQNLGMNSGVMAFDFITSPTPTSGFGNTESYGQKFAANGQIADSGKNLAQTIESWISVDAQTMDKNQFKTNVRKNVETMVRGLAPDNGNSCAASLSTLTKDVYYYDFSKLSGSAVNGNKGCVLSLQGQSSGTASGYRKLGVTGKKTIIVRGGNVYVDSDLSYGDSQSMLAIVVLRDDVDRTKGGNVLVNPKVTNVVGAGYVEGSLMSYDAGVGKVYDMDNTSEGELDRQLYWYGSLFSSNSIGGSLASGTSWECPFGSDTYETTKVRSCTQAESSRYDFAMLRRFLLINVGATDACYSATGKKAPKASGTDSEQYALAGKKRCYQSDANDVPELRSTSKTASFVMEYNPFMANAGMKVLSK